MNEALLAYIDANKAVRKANDRLNKAQAVVDEAERTAKTALDNLLYVKGAMKFIQYKGETYEITVTGLRPIKIEKV